MKNKLCFLATFLFFFQGLLYSQDISLCQFIGKNSQEVIKKFGKPLHHDKSNPYMECIYYQTKNSRMAFIADKEGVYQIQVDFMYNSEKEAKNALSNFLTECGKQNMKIDTLNVGDFKIQGPGVRMNLTLFENAYSKKYEIKFKADRSTIK
ncbi:hypothetical protein [Rosettibacter firmus]|uniref:hypothetical protein n=1 Tax=Rosettibacter firmus TaxID=3111522 RepID=UPI00336C2A4E